MRLAIFINFSHTLSLFCWMSAMLSSSAEIYVVAKSNYNRVYRNVIQTIANCKKLVSEIIAW